MAFVPCGGLSWLPVSFLLRVKYTLSYRIVGEATVFGYPVSKLTETPIPRNHEPCPTGNGNVGSVRFVYDEVR